jgi:hypothetical protein
VAYSYEYAIYNRLNINARRNWLSYSNKSLYIILSLVVHTGQVLLVRTQLLWSHKVAIHGRIASPTSTLAAWVRTH